VITTVGEQRQLLGVAGAHDGGDGRESRSPCSRPGRYGSKMIGKEGARLEAEAARRLTQLGCCEVEEGLTGGEFTRIEQAFGLEFADDHRAFLAAGLPTGAPPPRPGWIETNNSPWPDWRNGDPDELRKSLDWPVRGVLFDVGHGYWHDAWGTRPKKRADALKAARHHLAGVPRMIPVFGHRYLPAGRGTYGHPVLSIYQTDVICYGTDLADYINREFERPRRSITAEWQPQATVAFWRDFL
jgi:hypothetical protein